MKTLLNNQDAEIATLGSVIIDGKVKVIESQQDILEPGDFYVTKHQKIFRTMLDMQSQGISIDIVTLSSELSSRGWLDDIGGHNYLMYLIELTPSSANYRHYAKTVKEVCELRKISVFSQRLSQDIDKGTVDLSKAQDAICDFYDDISKQDYNSGIIRLSDEPVPDERKWILEDFIPMGFPTTLYSTGGVGKSYLAIYLAINISLGDKDFLNRAFHNEPANTLYLDFELDKTELTRRALEIARGMGLDSIPENFFYKSPETKISNLLRELPSFIKNNEIRFLVIDSMGAAGLDSMDEKSVIEVYSKLRELDMTALVIDHQSKMQSQDSPENKSPFGSVYKYNMSRSVIHLVHEKNIDNGFTVKLVHKKSNFGKLCDEELIDILVDKENKTVSINKSDSITQETEEMFMIRDAIVEMQKEQEYVNQKDLIGYFKNTIGKDRLIKLLNMGKGKYWIREKGLKGSSFVYIPIYDEEPQENDVEVKFGNSDPIYKQNLRISNEQVI